MQKDPIRIKDPLQHAVIRLGRMSSITDGGLLRPKANKYKNMFGTVLQVGSTFHPEDYRGRDVRPGDVVIFDNWLSLKEISPVGKNQHRSKFENIVGWLVGDGEVHDDRWAEEMLSESAQGVKNASAGKSNVPGPLGPSEAVTGQETQGEQR